MTSRTPVITGIGVVAPGALGAKNFWSLLTDGRTATRGITLFDAARFRSRVAAEVDFDPAAAGLAPPEIARMDRSAQFSVVSAREALADSGIELEEGRPDRIGVVVGSAVGATTSLEDEYVGVSGSGERWMVDEPGPGSHLYSHLVPSSVVREVAWVAGAQGPCTMISTGCTAGIDSIAHAARLVTTGEADVVVAGATEAPISPISLASFDAIGATTAANDDPEHASKPFDLRRDGFVLGEGSATLVIESSDHAQARGAHVYAEISGSATRSNAFHMTGLRPDGREMAEAIRVALASARIDPTQVGYVNAHGSGTKQNDRHETAAVKTTLGSHAYDIPMSSIKSMIGHSLGAIGAIEIAACALALEFQAVPPTANLRVADPECDLDYVPTTAREHRLDVALTVGSGFGGFQSAMLLRRPRGVRR